MMVDPNSLAMIFNFPLPTTLELHPSPAYLVLPSSSILFHRGPEAAESFCNNDKFRFLNCEEIKDYINTISATH